MLKKWLICAIMLVLVACAPTVEPNVNQGSSKKIIKPDTPSLAVVESIEPMILESFPVQAHATVKGHLIDGCVVLHGITAVRSDKTFTLDIDTTSEGDICTDALVPFEQTVVLDVVQLAAGTYTITAGEKSAQFTLNAGDTGAIDAAVNSLDGTQWEWFWGRYDDANMETFVNNRRVTLQFKDGQISGNAGCNNYSAPYTRNGDKINLGAVGATRKACAKDVMQIEGMYLLALGTAETISHRGGELQIDHANGHLGFRIEKPIETTLFIGPQRADCTGASASPKMCMRGRYAQTDDWQHIYGEIAGFTFEPGYETELRVRISPSDFLVDGPLLAYELLEIVSKTPAAP